MATQAPSSPEQAAEVLRGATAEGQRVRLRGGGTKSEWGGPCESAEVELSTSGLDRIVEHNAGDLTAVLHAGVPLAEAQEALAEAGQMIALDPPAGAGERATIGGVLATADSGPLRHRYGGARDLVLGIQVALADGTLARAGGKVIKNVAGYDLVKLFTGSSGTLGLIVEVVMRLHPRPAETVSAEGVSGDPDAIGRAAAAVAHSPLGPECLDVHWADGAGRILVRFAGAAPEAPACAAMELLTQAGLEGRLVEDDDELWAEQRARQRSDRGAVVRVSGLASELPRVLRSADALGGSVVGRAGMGLSWLTLRDEDSSDLVAAVEEVRRRLARFPCVVLDAPVDVREKVDVWGDVGALALMRRVKDRFDPHRVCNPGIYVGGI